MMGACADLMVQPYGAVVAGCVAGCVSTFGYQIIQVPFIRTESRVQENIIINRDMGLLTSCISVSDGSLIDPR